MKIMLFNISKCLERYLHQVFPDADFDSKTPDLAVIGCHDTNLDIRPTLHGMLAPSQHINSVVLISSTEVYSPDAGEDVGEETRPQPATDYGRRCLEAEDELRLWSNVSSAPVSILRVATMFGEDMEGWPTAMFNDVISGRYLHVRGQEGRLSLVTALDVALAVKLIQGMRGIYNVTDGRGATWLQLAEAMSANAGARKRMITLPEKWAALAWKTAKWLPAVKASLSPESMEARSLTCVVSSRKLQTTIPWQPHNTLEVLAGEADDYPYLSKEENRNDEVD